MAIRRVNVSWNSERHPAMEAFWQSHRGDFSAAVRSLVEGGEPAGPVAAASISPAELEAAIEQAVARARAEWQTEMDRRLRSLGTMPAAAGDPPAGDRLEDEELDRLARAGEASAGRWKQDGAGM